MRIRSGNQQTERVDTLELPADWVIAQPDSGHVSIVGGSLSVPGDITIQSDNDASGAGDIIFKTKNVERARILATGTTRFTTGGNSITGVSIKANGSSYNADFLNILGSADQPIFRFGLTILESGTGGPAGYMQLLGANGSWIVAIDATATIPGRDFAIGKVGGWDGLTPGAVHDCFYIEHNGTSPPSIQINNSSAFAPQGSLEVMMATDGSGNVRDTSASNVVIHTALITGGTPQTQPAIRMRNWTSGTDRFHLEADGSINVYDAGGGNTFTVASTSGIASFKGTALNVGVTAFGTSSHNLFVHGGAADTDFQMSTTAGGSIRIVCLNASGTVDLWTTNNSDLILGTNATARLTIAKTTGGVTHAYSETLAGAQGDSTLETKTPVIAGAFTLTRLNYLKLSQPTGAATITDAAVFQFDAAIGTHKAVDAGTTKTSPGTVTAWVKVNINGTIHYLPAYSSKTT